MVPRNRGEKTMHHPQPSRRVFLTAISPPSERRDIWGYTVYTVVCWPIPASFQYPGNKGDTDRCFQERTRKRFFLRKKRSKWDSNPCPRRRQKCYGCYSYWYWTTRERGGRSIESTQPRQGHPQRVCIPGIIYRSTASTHVVQTVWACQQETPNNRGKPEILIGASSTFKHSLEHRLRIIYDWVQSSPHRAVFLNPIFLAFSKKWALFS